MEKIEMIIVCMFLIAMLLCIVLYVKNDVTCRSQIKIARAIYEYGDQLISEHRFDEIQVDYADMEPYSKTLFRLWDWGYTRILPREKYEIIKEYIEE